MGLQEILKQYAESAVDATDAAFEHFDAVARQTTVRHLGDGLAAVFTSVGAPAFGQAVSRLFGHSDPEQKAALINEIIQAVGPAVALTASNGALGRMLCERAGPITPVSTAVAMRLAPSDLSSLASTARERDGSFVHRLATFYAQQPALIKILGANVLGSVMFHMTHCGRSRQGSG